jgi:cyclophilin family peptidyl-prolyl cis-trans isomerase
MGSTGRLLLIAAFGLAFFSLATLMINMGPSVDTHTHRRLGVDLHRRTPAEVPVPVAAAAEAEVVAESAPAPTSEPEATPVSPACAAQLFPETELGGDVVRWGADHLVDSAADCCAACAAAAGCSVFVYCASAEACGEYYRQCWLKRLDDAWSEIEFAQGKSSRWVSGIKGARPPPSASRRAEQEAAPEFALVTEAGDVRVRLFADSAPLAADFFRAVVRAAPACANCRFYRAEPVPAVWGSTDAPDTWKGGRWGPPYALMQGNFLPSKPDVPGGAALPPKPPAETSQRARPMIRRGMLAWAGGGGGPDGFIALAQHPEWGHGHTVFGEVVAEDMDIVDRLMERPIRSEDWGAITASVFVEPLTFSLRALPGLRAPAAAGPAD